MRHEKGPATDGVLRDVVEADLPHFFDHQSDVEACRMAAFAPRGKDDFTAHWARILADDSVIKKTVVVEHEVAGNIVSFEQSGKRFVGYWIGKEYWGNGLATRALRDLLLQVATRPLYASVATTNAGSIRVLEKCGFAVVSSDRSFDAPLGQEVEEALFELR